MGDRANIVIETRDNERLFFYTHWGGSEVPLTVQEALKRRARWEDTPYLARIVFCTLCTDVEGETGFGIDTQMGDNSYPLLLLKPEKRTVELHGFDSGKWDVKGGWNEPLKSWTFDEFCEISDISWDAISA